MAASPEKPQTSIGWIAHAFKGGDAQRKGDIPGLIAKWLFRIGAVWACLLLPVTVIFGSITLGMAALSLTDHSVFKMIDHGWVIAPFLFCGYAVWIGWGWRGLKIKGITFRILFWAISAAFNLILPVLAWKNEHALWLMFMPNVLWPILASAASLVALCFELRLRPYASNVQ